MRHLPEPGLRDAARGGRRLQGPRAGGERQHAAGHVRAEGAGLGEAVRPDPRAAPGGPPEGLPDVHGPVHRVVSGGKGAGWRADGDGGRLQREAHGEAEGGDEPLAALPVAVALRRGLRGSAEDLEVEGVPCCGLRRAVQGGEGSCLGTRDGSAGLPAGAGGSRLREGR